MFPSSILLSYDTWLFVVIFVVTVGLGPFLCPLWKTLVRRLHLIVPLNEAEENMLASTSNKTKHSKDETVPLRLMTLDKIIDRNSLSSELRSMHRRGRSSAGAFDTSDIFTPLPYQDQLVSGSSLLLAVVLYIFALLAKWSACCIYYGGPASETYLMRDMRTGSSGRADGVLVVPVIVLSVSAFLILATMTRINVANVRYRLEKLSAHSSKIATMCTILSVTFVFFGSSPNVGRIRGEPLVDTDLGVGLDLLTARLENLFKPLGYERSFMLFNPPVD
eukprot:GHVS01085532.1.p2 GENE.GHVS01085532.1~~GHVS01085532.1.p2  ORF type:complete len:277 (+),score=6.26 GHVS01085532.1:150-980(+)